MTAKTMEFKAELKQVMDIIIHSLYSHREIFLRELISNACDAIDKVRFDAIQDKSLLNEGDDWKIIVKLDKQQQTVTVSDNGIGMTRERLIEDLGTIARSGTREFLANLQKADAKDRPELIGQFGVGFYSAFMVADRVTVVSRAAGQEQAVQWVSDGEGQYEVDEAQREGRGTDVILHLRDDAKEFLEEWKIRAIVKDYSNFVEHPVELALVDDKGEAQEVKEPVMNERTALWLRPKNEIKPEEYNEFYKQIARDFQDPARVIHYQAEGTMEFRALLFIPEQRPFDLYMGDVKTGPALYVQRVQIMDHCDKLLPPWLRFVKGVVDSSDLPLNVSRELLQQNATLARIQKNLVSRVLKELAEMKEKDYDAYVKFYENFGDVLKEGVGQDMANRDKIADLLLFHSTTADSEDKYISLAQYVETMPDDENEIYYLCGDNLEVLRSSPYLEAIREQGREVLLLNSPVDEWAMDAMRTYKEKTFKAVDKGELPGDEKDKEAREEQKKTYGSLLERLDKLLGDVKEVRLSSRMRESAACLVLDEHAMSAQMERLMKRMGQAMPESQRILELNPEHPVVKKMLDIFEEDRKDARIDDYGHLLYDQALIAEGSPIKDPAAFAERVNKLMVGAE